LFDKPIASSRAAHLPSLCQQANQVVAVPTITNPFNRFFVFQQIIIFCIFVLFASLPYSGVPFTTSAYGDGL
jgi:hypothetical protein